MIDHSIRQFQRGAWRGWWSASLSSDDWLTISSPMPTQEAADNWIELALAERNRRFHEETNKQVDHDQFEG